VSGDLNGDGKVDIADAVTVLNIMAASEYQAAAVLNGDSKVDIADFVTVLNLMAQQ
jgi:biopolymer transport protein ExbD